MRASNPKSHQRCIQLPHVNSSASISCYGYGHLQGKSIMQCNVGMLTILQQTVAQLRSAMHRAIHIYTYVVFPLSWSLLLTDKHIQTCWKSHGPNEMLAFNLAVIIKAINSAWTAWCTYTILNLFTVKYLHRL